MRLSPIWGEIDLSIAAKRRQWLESDRSKLVFEVLGRLAIARRARLAAGVLGTC